MLVDTHCHLDIIIEKLVDATKNSDAAQIANKIVSEAHAGSVEALITVGTTLATSRLLVAEYLQIPGVFGAVGIHPCDASDTWREECGELEQLFRGPLRNKILAIGECGLDFYHPGFVVEQQEALFRAEIECALQHNLPLIVHTRNAFDATLAIIDEYGQRLPRGVFHCFSEDLTAAQKVVNRGFLLGMGGAVTYPKNQMLRDVVRSIGLDHFVLETDAPFLPPQGFRGTINTPAHVATVAHFLAEFLGRSYEEISEKTTANAKRLFATDFV
ncbi:MAG: TatD family hydrolase [Candidatus Dependentiae bacterium]|nr:TatD family hydrolase [Candidatus Dependentiae bacterium]